MYIKLNDSSSNPDDGGAESFAAANIAAVLPKDGEDEEETRA